MSEPKSPKPSTMAELRNLPDDELIAWYDHSRKQQDIGIEQFAREIDRRENAKQSNTALTLARRQDEQTQSMLELSRRMDTYTRKVTTLTYVTTFAAVVGAVAAIIQLFK